MIFLGARTHLTYQIPFGVHHDRHSSHTTHQAHRPCALHHRSHNHSPDSQTPRRTPVRSRRPLHPLRPLLRNPLHPHQPAHPLLQILPITHHLLAPPHQRFRIPLGKPHYPYPHLPLLPLQPHHETMRFLLFPPRSMPRLPGEPALLSVPGILSGMRVPTGRSPRGTIQNPARSQRYQPRNPSSSQRQTSPGLTRSERWTSPAHYRLIVRVAVDLTQRDFSMI